MQLSIVIPTFNESHNIGKLVRYLASQTDPEQTEILVINACKTTDNTANIAAAAGAKVYECEACCRAAQLNMGARLANYHTLYFVHADVQPPQNFSTSIEKALQNGYDFGWFSYQFDSPNRWLKINAHWTRSDGIFAGGGDQTLFIRRPIFQQLKGFREDYIIMEDFEFVKRAKRMGLPYTIVPKDVLVSARKYDRNSYLKVNIVNFIMFVLFTLRCRQDWMLRFYKGVLH